MVMGIPGPQNARGKILTNLFPSPGRYKELTILGISDYHGQLIPLSETADTVGPSFAIGGAAYLKPWFHANAAEAPNGPNPGPALPLPVGGEAVTVSPADRSSTTMAGAVSDQRVSRYSPGMITRMKPMTMPIDARRPARISVVEVHAAASQKTGDPMKVIRGKYKESWQGSFFAPFLDP